MNYESPIYKKVRDRFLMASAIAKLVAADINLGSTYDFTIDGELIEAIALQLKLAGDEME